MNSWTIQMTSRPIHLRHCSASWHFIPEYEWRKTSLAPVLLSVIVVAQSSLDALKMFGGKSDSVFRENSRFLWAATVFL